MKDCDPQDVAIKSFFLGPQNENGAWLRKKWLAILDNWLGWRATRFPEDGKAITEQDQSSPEFIEALERMDQAVNRVLKDLEGETPKFTPRYIGHMVSEVSLPAVLGHVCALLHNPNNTSREVSRVTSRLESEAISQLGTMLGFPNTVQGHFTSGGTLANFEALWRAIVRFDQRMKDELNLSLLDLGPWEFAARYFEKTNKQFRGPVVLVPQNKHFSWEKAVSLMGFGAAGFQPIALDREGRLCLRDLTEKIEIAQKNEQPILMLVSVAGTTEMGEVDPIDRVQDLLDSYRVKGLDIWHHVDGAYGGYYCSLLDQREFEAKLDPRVSRAFRAIRRVDSVTLDPHKLGYVPYSCGAFLARNEEHYTTRSFGAAYLLDNNSSRWAFTLEGSRSGAGVTATWLSNQVLGLNEKGYGRLLAKGLEAKEQMIEELTSQIPGFLPVTPMDLNIICFSIAQNGTSLSSVNSQMLKIFNCFEDSPHFSISKTILKQRDYGSLIERLACERQLKIDDDHWVKLRLVLMNPFIASKAPRTNFIREFVSELKRFISDNAVL